MSKDGLRLRHFVGTSLVLSFLSFPGCGEGDLKTAPEPVLKAKKEDFGKDQLDADKAAKSAGKTKPAAKDR